VNIPLNFKTLREANTKRLPLFKDKQGRICHMPDGSDWSDAQWLQALVGELGEYANLKKKVERGDLTFEDAKDDLARELADIVTYIDLLAFRLNIDLGEAVRQKFNEVSNRIGVSIKITYDGDIIE
jgi:NTP pyrophosphatase (non-canonical NTP hydrolase)